MKDMNVVTNCPDCPFFEYDEMANVEFCDHPKFEGNVGALIITNISKIPDKCPLRIGPTAIVVKLA